MVRFYSQLHFSTTLLVSEAAMVSITARPPLNNASVDVANDVKTYGSSCRTLHCMRLTFDNAMQTAWKHAELCMHARIFVLHL